jgi:hypothetical protein
MDIAQRVRGAIMIIMKKRKSTDRHKSRGFTMRIPDHLLALLDEYVATVRPPTTRSGVVITWIEDRLRQLKLAGDPKGNDDG